MPVPAKPRTISLTNFVPLLESGRGIGRSKPQPGGGRVFTGVTIIKSGLGNRRDRNYYPPDTLKEAADKGMFEGLKAYADHPTSVDEQIQPERSIRDYVGLYTNTRFSEKAGGRVVGDLRILRAHKWLSDVVDELIEVGAADKIGISINGRGHTVPGKARLEESGEEVDVNEVRQFIDLRSADVVTEAGAGGGFPQILESARGAAKETRMTRTEMLKKLQEAAEAGDLETVKALTAQLAEAGLGNFKGKKSKPFGKKAAEAEPEEVEEAEEAEETEEAEGEGDDGDGDGKEPEDADEALDKAVEAAKAGSKVEDESETEDEDGEDEDDLEEACAERARRKKVAEASGPLTKGAPAGGAGTMTKKASSKKAFSGRKFGESDDEADELHTLRMENARLHAKLSKTSQRNERLAEALRVRQKADIARKLLKESGIPAEARADFVARLVELPDEQAMQAEIRFHQRLVESTVGRVKADLAEEFDEVEGAGSSLRESYAGSGADDLAELLAGLPIKEKK